MNAFDLERIKRVRRVYPILVVQDFSLALGFANWNLRVLFSEEIAKAEIPPGLIRPITVMTVEDLEAVMPCLKHVTLQNILEYHARHLEPILTFKYIFSHYMRRRKVNRRPNAWVEGRVHDVIESMRAMFHEVD